MLDSDVIFSRVLHELLGRIAAEAGLLSLIWSDELLAEAARSLQHGKGLTEEVAARWVGRLPRAFPDGRVSLADLADEVDLATLTNDPDDEHVCALAIAGGASLLFAFDQGYNQHGLRLFGVDVVHPDAWLAITAAQEPALFVDVLERQAAAWVGGRTAEELLAALERARVPEFVTAIRPHLQ